MGSQILAFLQEQETSPHHYCCKTDPSPMQPQVLMRVGILRCEIEDQGKRVGKVILTPHICRSLRTLSCPCHPGGWVEAGR